MKEHKFNALLLRIRDGDMTALEPIYSEYYPKLAADARYILNGDGVFVEIRNWSEVISSIYYAPRPINQAHIY